VLPGAVGRRQLLAIDQGHHLIDSGTDGGVVLTLAQQRHHGVFDDAIGRRVGEHALQTVAVLDAQLVIVLGEDQQRTVIDLLAPELPGVGDADRILLDLFRMRRRHQQHRDLRALARFEVAQFLRERWAGESLAHHTRTHESCGPDRWLPGPRR